MKKTVLLTFVLLVIGSGIIGYYLFNKPHINVEKGNIDFTLTPDQILSEYMNNNENASRKFNEKIILVRGTYKNHSISAYGIPNILIEGENVLVSCEMDTLQSDPEKINLYQKNQPLKIKGLLVGMDELLGEIQMKNCLLVN